MRCPRCDHEQEESVECRRCGLIFERYRHAGARQPAQKSGMPRARDELFLGAPASTETLSLALRGLLLAVLILWGFTIMWATPAETGEAPGFLHLVNTPFHEAGHILFSPFGALVTSLGGSLGQILMPLVCCLTLLLKTRDPFGAGVALWWLGQNFIDIAPYINDARAGELMLLGGNTGQSSPYGFHDWEFILTELGLQGWDHGIAWAAHLTGAAVMIIGLSWGALVLRRHGQVLKAPKP
jgi:hypothetical protein